MPSFKSVLFALATLSVSVMANPIVQGEQTLEKRRVNNADAYGYPHNQGPHIDNGKKMTPGGYVDPRKPTNLGSACRKNTNCHNNKPLAVGYCDKEEGKRVGVCSFTCIGTSVKRGNRCIGAYNAPMCKITANCKKPTAPNASPACIDGVCRIQCDAGFHLNGSATRCDRNKTTCGGKAPPTVTGGFATCKMGKWMPECNQYPGGKIYSAGPNAFVCINTNVDPNNCGRAGNVCPAGYNGLGSRTCKAGFCGLDCGAGQRKRTLPDGRKYCSTM